MPWTFLSGLLQTTMRRNLPTLGVVMALLLFLLFPIGAYFKGRMSAQAEFANQQHKLLEQTHAHYLQALDQGEKTVQNLQQKNQQLSLVAQRLQQEVHRAPLLTQTAHPDAASPANPTPPLAYDLSLHAVRVWNAALEGRAMSTSASAINPTPSGTDSAAAQPSLVSIEQAWQNHIDNALLCSAVRNQLNGLIDYLQSVKP